MGFNRVYLGFICGFERGLNGGLKGVAIYPVPNLS